VHRRGSKITERQRKYSRRFTPAAEARTTDNSTTDYQDYPKINGKANSSHEVQEQIF
jgi:hypothetical protein